MFTAGVTSIFSSLSVFVTGVAIAIVAGGSSGNFVFGYELLATANDNAQLARHDDLAQSARALLESGNVDSPQSMAMAVGTAINQGNLRRLPTPDRALKQQQQQQQAQYESGTNGGGSETAGVASAQTFDAQDIADFKAAITEELAKHNGTLPLGNGDGNEALPLIATAAAAVVRSAASKCSAKVLSKFYYWPFWKKL